MPRDISGNATPPPGSEAIPATVISSTVENTLTADIYSLISDTVSVQGVPPMQAPLKFADGSSSAPGIAWNSQANTGLFKPTGAAIGLTVEAVEAARISSARNFLIGTTGDTGERLNVSGTSKLAGLVTVTTGGLAVTGTSTLTGNTTITGNAAITGTLGVGGDTALAGNLSITGTTTGITKVMVGLGNVDNTTDVAKPVSSAVQALIDGLKADRRGSIFASAFNAVPSGALACNGAAVSRATYAALFALIGTTYGAGDSSTTFNVPDLRGEFLRGFDNGRGADAGRVFASSQAAANAAHVHGVNDPSHAHGVYDPGHAHTTDVQGHHAHGSGQLASGGGAVNLGFNFVAASQVSGATDGAGNHAHNVYAAGTSIGIYGNGTGISIQSSGTEARPRNVAVLYCIWA